MALVDEEFNLVAKLLAHMLMKYIIPFNTMFEIMHMTRTPETMGGIEFSGRDSKMLEMLERLEKSDAWNNAKKTMDKRHTRRRYKNCKKNNFKIT
ncbi:hypothetical protein [Clostridium amylolyticum]|uniref:hypothetical protein n=1 Tax=Clostridium amylolyticum TaxID=1121298 RepID=UPI001160C9CE|nr:hypothetical protein [Clostridium amylolyticum]